MKSKKPELLALVKLCCRALDDKKAGDLRVLDVSEQSSITDYLIVATGSSEPHLRALRVEIEKVLDTAKAHIIGMDVSQESGWMVIDAFDLMVHIFTDDTRARYGLENLWKDAVELSVPELLDQVKPKAPAKKKAKAPAAKKPKAAAKAPAAAKKAVKKTAAKAKKPA